MSTSVGDVAVRGQVKGVRHEAVRFEDLAGQVVEAGRAVWRAGDRGDAKELIRGKGPRERPPEREPVSHRTGLKVPFGASRP
jgi:hypothetical protein